MPEKFHVKLFWEGCHFSEKGVSLVIRIKKNASVRSDCTDETSKLTGVPDLDNGKHH